jgi:hypothetical protein
VTFEQPSLWNGPAPSVPSQPMVRHDDHDVRDGLVEQVFGDDGKPLRRPSDTGAPALVWRAVP